MLIELADALRCPAPHAGGHLVLSIDERRGAAVWRGTLGCPTCRALHRIERGVAHFGIEPGALDEVAPSSVARDDAFRVMALLGLAEPGGTVLLEGDRAALVEPLLDLCAAHYVLVNAPFALERDDVSALRVAGTLPLAPGALRAAALGAATGLTNAIEAVALATASKGRVLAPAGVALPATLHQLASDERDVVAEREAAASAPVTLRRARPFTAG